MDWLLILLLLWKIICITYGLKDVKVIIPQAVSVGGTVFLQCRFNLEGEPLYTVKWYKGQKEFYRFIPKELPNIQVFPLPGVKVDLYRSTPNQVVLLNVQPEVTGKFRCEVSTDAPNFYTVIKTGYMFVIDIPKENPHIKIEGDSREIGYSLKAHCISPPTYPAVNLTWYVNEKKINATSSIYIYESNNTRNGQMPKTIISKSEIEIDEGMFDNGFAHLHCVAKLFNLYCSEADIILQKGKPHHKLPSILGNCNIFSGSASNVHPSILKYYYCYILCVVHFSLSVINIINFINKSIH